MQRGSKHIQLWHYVEIPDTQLIHDLATACRKLMVSFQTDSVKVFLKEATASVLKLSSTGHSGPHHYATSECRYIITNK
jgi:hypothetical protein